MFILNEIKEEFKFISQSYAVATGWGMVYLN
jgi:hypothetical protein